MKFTSTFQSWDDLKYKTFTVNALDLIMKMKVEMTQIIIVQLQIVMSVIC